MALDDLKCPKGDEWRFIGHNCPQVEVIGPWSNQYKILIQDIDGDLIALKPSEAKDLIKRLEEALEGIRTRRRKPGPKPK